MPTLESRAESLFKRPVDAKQVEVTTTDAVLSAAPPEPQPFSVFIAEHQEAALRVTAEMMAIANATPGDEGLEQALARAEEEAEQSSVELAQYALAVFITHYPRARKLPIPRLEEAQPHQVQPAHPETAQLDDASLLGAFGDEALLDWYREDASANDHHLRWHRVYPAGGHPDPNDPDMFVTADRQGELFLYMHEQMLARYDTERLGAGLDKAEALTDYQSALPQGYDPNIQGFNRRLPDSLMTDSTWPNTTVAQLEGWTKAIFDDIDAGAPSFQPTPKRPTADLLGGTVEANVGSVNRQKFGNLHNMGHMIIARIPDPDAGPNQPGGVMRSVAVAIRDPIFYRWHRRVDDSLATWQEAQDPQDFSDNPGDVEPVEVTIVPASKVTGDPPEYDYGAPTDTLRTYMRTRQIGGTDVAFLDHEDFWYFIRAKNHGEEQVVTVRIFLVAEEWIEDRRRWIELDKFQQTLPAGESTIARSSKLASVVRKPARRPDEPPPTPDAGTNADYCDCGWPYHLLLPRGKKEGMPFRLLVMFDKDSVAQAGKCSSISFCGKMNADYPDVRPMGYPFDRRWDGGIEATIGARKNMALRDLTIRWTDAPGT